MAINYASMQATGRRLIRDNGRPAVLRSMQLTGDEFDPIRTPVDTPVQVVQTDFKTEDVQAGWIIEDRDKAFLLGPYNVVDTTMQLVDGTTAYEIVQVREIKPGPLTMLYKVQARL